MSAAQAAESAVAPESLAVEATTSDVEAFEFESESAVSDFALLTQPVG